MKPLLLAVLAFAADPFADGVRAFRAGDASAAQTYFAAALEQRGERASAALHYDFALAALHAGDFAAARSGAEEAVARAPQRFRSRTPFLLGCAEALRAEDAARLAASPGAIPADWDLALARGGAAVDAFALALTASDEDLPAARRNAERMLLRLAEWERARAAAAPPRAEAQPVPEPAPARVEELLERLDRQERPPPASPQPAAGVERDW